MAVKGGGRRRGRGSRPQRPQPSRARPQEQSARTEANTSPRKGSSRFSGVVEEALPDALFRVRLEDGRMVLAHLAGKLRVHFIRVVVGDRVLVELSPYDETRGRIIYRGR